ncbi:hypothetical protein WJX79_008730 [Trebouxia sp. C0005]
MLGRNSLNSTGPLHANQQENDVDIISSAAQSADGRLSVAAPHTSSDLLPQDSAQIRALVKDSAQILERLPSVAMVPEAASPSISTAAPFVNSSMQGKSCSGPELLSQLAGLSLDAAELERNHPPCPPLPITAQDGEEQSGEEDDWSHSMDGSGIPVEELSQTARQVSRQLDKALRDFLSQMRSPSPDNDPQDQLDSSDPEMNSTAAVKSPVRLPAMAATASVGPVPTLVSRHDAAQQTVTAAENISPVKAQELLTDDQSTQTPRAHASPRRLSRAPPGRDPLWPLASQAGLWEGLPGHEKANVSPSRVLFASADMPGADAHPSAAYFAVPPLPLHGPHLAMGEPHYHASSRAAISGSLPDGYGRTPNGYGRPPAVPSSSWSAAAQEEEKWLPGRGGPPHVMPRHPPLLPSMSQMQRLRDTGAPEVAAPGSRLLPPNALNQPAHVLTQRQRPRWPPGPVFGQLDAHQQSKSAAVPQSRGHMHGQQYHAHAMYSDRQHPVPQSPYFGPLPAAHHQRRMYQSGQQMNAWPKQQYVSSGPVPQTQSSHMFGGQRPSGMCPQVSPSYQP